MYGSTVAAPFVQEVLSNALSYAGVQPDQSNQSATVPDVRGMTVTEAVSALKSAGLDAVYLEAEADSTVSKQSPVANTVLVKGSPVVLYSTGYAFFAELEEETETVQVPKLMNKNRMDALDALKKVGLIMEYDHFHCAGEVIDVEYEEGFEVPVGTVVHVRFSSEENAGVDDSE